MERCLRKDEDCPQLLDLIPKNRGDEQRSHNRSSEEKELELRLGPPGEIWGTKNDEFKSKCKETDEKESLLSLGNYFNHQISTISGAKRGFMMDEQDQNCWTMNNNGGHKQNPVGPTMSSPWLSSPRQQPRGADVAKLLQNGEEKAFSPTAGATANTSVQNNKSKRTGPAPVVGWPPIRSSRKNLASTSKPSPELQNGINSVKPPMETSHKGLFVKINMDGVPIGRKVDLKAYDTYQKLASAVDELFRGLLAAQGDSFGDGAEKAITGLLDGSGEYTLVYQDNEGDRMLVGDVPWHMFVSTVRRLRVLKSSELSTICLGSSKQGKIPPDAASRR